MSALLPFHAVSWCAGAPGTTTNNITNVIQTVLAAQLVGRGLLDGNGPSAGDAKLPSSLSNAPVASGRE